MANTRQSAKRARQAKKRETRNTLLRTQTKTALKKAVQALKTKNAEAKSFFVEAVRALDKAGTSGQFPKGKASRKISRLTMLAKKIFPEALNFKN